MDANMRIYIDVCVCKISLPNAHHFGQLNSSFLLIVTVQDSNEAYHVMCQPSGKAHHISNATCSSTKEDTLNPVHHQERDKAHQPVDKAVPNGLHLSWLVEGFFCTSLLNSR